MFRQPWSVAERDSEQDEFTQKGVGWVNPGGGAASTEAPGSTPEVLARTGHQLGGLWG